MNSIVFLEDICKIKTELLKPWRRSRSGHGAFCLFGSDHSNEKIQLNVQKSNVFQVYNGSKLANVLALNGLRYVLSGYGIPYFPGG
jgi:hypothetical protein